MDAIEAIITRRSVRQFTGEMVTDEQLDIMLRAAMNAPSAGNERPWRFVVVRDAAALERLSRATLFAKPLSGAGAGIAVCADRLGLKYPGFWPIDCSAATQNLLLAAHAMGLGGVWIGVHPIGPFKTLVRRALDLPRHITPVSLIALGHPAHAPVPIERYDPHFVHFERWGGD